MTTLCTYNIIVAEQTLAKPIPTICRAWGNRTTTTKMPSCQISAYLKITNQSKNGTPFTSQIKKLLSMNSCQVQYFKLKC